jgi:hypothetical protein
MNNTEYQVGKAAVDESALMLMTHAQAAQQLPLELQRARLRLLFDAGTMNPKTHQTTRKQNGRPL